MSKNTESILSYLAAILIIVNILMISNIFCMRRETVEAYANIARNYQPARSVVVIKQPEIPEEIIDPAPASSIKNAIVYGYSSTIDQTDADPLTTASGEKVKIGIIGNNCLPFGTVVEFDGQKFTVLDRMNERYGCQYFDRWFESREAALQWGKRTVAMKIYQ